LAILAFSLSLVGTFIVRSGLLTSVHSFASDPARGVFILGILLVAVGVPLLLYAWRGPRLMTIADFNLKSREGALIANNMLLVVATAIVLLGTFYPLGLEMITGARITVGPPYFDATFNPVMGVLTVIMVFGPVMAWRRGATPRIKTTILAAAVAAAISGTVGIALVNDMAIGALAAVMLIGWLAAGIGADIWAQLRPSPQLSLAARWQRLPRDVLGMWIAHFGIVVFLLGATGDGLFRSEQVVRAKPGDIIEVAGREVKLLRVFERQGPNFQALTAELEYRDAVSGRFIARLMPEKRVYTAERQTTTEAAIRPRPGGDDYAVLGDGDDRIGYSLRLYYKPLISWIWGGTALMALGGLVAMTGRRRQSAPNNSDIKTAADVKAMARGRA
jgi:cytochrome c-type biogenesis protein CcmF